MPGLQEGTGVLDAGGAASEGHQDISWQRGLPRQHVADGAAKRVTRTSAIDCEGGTVGEDNRLNFHYVSYRIQLCHMENSCKVRIRIVKNPSLWGDQGQGVTKSWSDKISH